jgi:hypothetical protein
MKYLSVIVLVPLLCAFAGCLTKKELDLYIYFNNSPLPEQFCEVLADGSKVGLGWGYGFYRRLNDGKLQFISFCHPDAKNWIAMHKDDYKKITDSLVSSD